MSIRTLGTLSSPATLLGSSFLALTLLLAGIPAHAATETTGKRVLVMQLRAADSEQELARTLMMKAGELIKAQAGHDAVTVADITAMAAELALDPACDEADCLADVAAAVQTRYVVVGSIGKVGKRLVLGLSLLDVDERRGGASVADSATTGEALVAALPRLLGQLFAWPGAQADAVAYALPKGKKVSFAIFDMKAMGIDEDSAKSLSQVLAAALKGIEGASVITQEDIRSMLQLEAQKQQLGCDDETCFAEIGGALGVDKLVVGSVSKLGAQLVISLQLLDAGAGKVEGRLTESFRGEEAQLVPAVRLAGRRLLGFAATEPGSLVVSATESDAEIFIDDEARGELPMPAIAGLAPGRHRLRVSKGGYFDWQGEVYVEPNATTAAWATLEERPPAWYQRWWVWGAAGAVVVGAATFFIVSARALPDTELGNVNIE